MMKNFGTGMFVFPHQVAPGSNGNVWVVDGRAADGKGMQVMKVSPYGKGLMALGKAGQGGKALTCSTADIGGDRIRRRCLRRRRPCTDFGNSRIRKFDNNGKFIMTFGRVGSADGEFKSPHVIVFDSHGRLFVADRGNSRVNIFDQNGKCPPGWKQFGRPSGIGIDKNDLYVTDCESKDAPGKDANNPGCNVACPSVALRRERSTTTSLRHQCLTRNSRHRRVSRSILMVRSTPRRCRPRPSTNM